MRRETVLTAVALMVLAAAVVFCAWYDTKYAYLISSTISSTGQTVGPVKSQAVAQGGDATLTNWIQAISAIVSAFFAGAVFFVYITQAQIMKGQLNAVLLAAEAARQSAEAAKMQADKSVSDMRAHMVPGFPLDMFVRVPGYIVRIRVTNVGRAGGTVGDTYVAFSDEMPPASFADKATMQKRADSTVLLSEDHLDIGDFKSASLKEGQFCFGFIEFSDELGRWQRRFCMQVRKRPLVGVNYFHEVGGQAYNDEERLD